MCGIVGYYALGGPPESFEPRLEAAVNRLGKRGPDNSATFRSGPVGLGHTRLSILDTSASANQPMHDPSGRFTLVFNGEIYNYKELITHLEGVNLQTTSDTEVLLHLLIRMGRDCLDLLNGFFAFAFYDHHTEKLLLARDAMGIKPLHVYQDEDLLIFSSELKAILEFPIKRSINPTAFSAYLSMNYLPGQMSMLQGMRKVLPGHFLEIQDGTVEEDAFWKLTKGSESRVSYQDAKSHLVELLDASVRRRLISDVPLGSFLSGGTDSSAIVALASRHVSSLKTFSIGYAELDFFDETAFAELVAEKFKTDHTTFKLTNDDLLSDLDEVLDYIDEPFADSSMIPTYILSKRVRKHVTVALSGDGADELFGGYYKHQALARSLQPSMTDHLVRAANPLMSLLPQSRSGGLSNLVRRANKLGQILSQNPVDRYRFLASPTPDPAKYLMNSDVGGLDPYIHALLPSKPDMNDYLLADQQLVLPGDMLTKVDLMSMANSLEVRVPFLDKSVVTFANSLPAKFKVGPGYRKKILQEAFREILPAELYQRPKKGFEVPLLQWMRTELLGRLDQLVFNRDMLEDQGLFDSQAIMSLRTKLLSRNPGDVHALLWAIFVFQHWYQRYLR